MLDLGQKMETTVTGVTIEQNPPTPQLWPERLAEVAIDSLGVACPVAMAGLALWAFAEQHKPPLPPKVPALGKGWLA
jgi:hypothetical protein